MVDIAQLKDLIVNGVGRFIGKVYASEFIGKLTGNADTATSASKATGVVDYGATSKTIQIGYGGSGATTDNLTHIAGYIENGTRIKDVSKDVLKSWLGLGSLAYSSATIPTIPSSLPANGGNSSTVNGHTVNSDVPANAKFTDTWRPLGNTADTACAGNDSRLSNARPASDVYAWAKATTKPSYTKSEVGLGNVDNTADADKSVKNADKLYNKSNDYYGVWLGVMTISKGTGAGMSQSVAEDPLHRYIKPTSIIDIYYDDNSVQYASEIGMLYNIQESGGIYYLSIAPKKDVVKQDIVIQNILVRNP